jgi:protein-tyrosine phosphatase
MTTRILFVCLGNICRSPAAEGVVRQFSPDLELDSAGTSDWHVGEAPYGPMQTAAKARGFDLSPLRARQFRSQDFAEFDLIVAMDHSNQDRIEALRPKGNDTPVTLFAEYAEGWGASEVPDPYYTRDFDGVLDLIEDAARGMIAQL